ncbi:hypothetical protein EDB83DRAFT_2318346 [Lactarius deliciosus]|nr:hypothetical protein EDB83DRAFT_2318346 [Lactarius deliciosus]
MTGEGEASYRFIRLSFCLTGSKLTRGGGDALEVSREYARAKGYAIAEMLCGVDHAVFVFVEGVWIGFAVRRCALGTHALWRILREEVEELNVAVETFHERCNEERDLVAVGMVGYRIAGTHDGWGGWGEQKWLGQKGRRPGSGRRRAVTGWDIATLTRTRVTRTHDPYGFCQPVTIPSNGSCAPRWGGSGEGHSEKYNGTKKKKKKLISITGLKPSSSSTASSCWLQERWRQQSDRTGAGTQRISRPAF